MRKYTEQNTRSYPTTSDHAGVRSESLRERQGDLGTGLRPDDSSPHLVPTSDRERARLELRANVLLAEWWRAARQRDQRASGAGQRAARQRNRGRGTRL